jgi:DNA-binding MarR family transcriptional regulator
MSKGLNLTEELIKHVKEYEKVHDNDDIKEFSIYLKDKLFSSHPNKTGKIFNKDEFHNYVLYPEIEFSALLTGLYRFSKHYLKKAFAGSKINTIDEFGFMATLLKEGSLLKNELINKHLLEVSSGSEIIKRLQKNGLIKEYPDENDKRAKRVTLTREGKKEIFSSFDDMYKVSRLIVGDLTSDELNNSLQIFNKLSYFHHHIYDYDKKTQLDELHEKYLTS